MAILLNINIGSNYEELETIVELKIQQTMNDHGYLHLGAILQESAKTKYVTEVKALEKIEVASFEKGKIHTMFKGIVKKATVRQVKKVYYLFIEAVTGSYIADIEMKSRSFQNKEMTYRSLLKSIITEYEDGDLIDCASEGAKVDKFTMQYRESDWDFVKRMASRFHAGILPSMLFDTPKIFIGKPQGTERGKIEKYNYFVTKDLERYMLSFNNGNRKLKQLDTVTFHLDIMENVEIGDKMTYYDKASDNIYANLYINNKEIELIDGVLHFRYGLCTSNGFLEDKLYNEQIVGLSIKGVVKERIQDKVMVELEIDKGKEVSENWQFPYATPYAAGGHGGWYVMPEIGDTVLINFPDKDETNGIGINSIRENGKETEKIATPDVKCLRTFDGKEIRLAPDEVVITCSNWVSENTGEENKIYIQLNERGGITIQSTKPININSDSDINFTADKKILFAAEEEIKMRCKSSMVKIDSAIELVSSVIKVN